MLPLRLPEADFFDSIRDLAQAREAVLEEVPKTPFLALSPAGLFAWRDRLAYAWCTKGEARFLIAVDGSIVYFPRPPVPFSRKTLELAFQYLKRIHADRPEIIRVEGLNEAQSVLARSWGLRVESLSLEYLYERSKIASLSGRFLRAKRAQRNHLQKHHFLVFRPFQRGDFARCLELYDTWCNRKKAAPACTPEAKTMLEASRSFHLRLLSEGEDWGVSTWVVEVDGILRAYTAGGPLTHDVFGVYMEVADWNFKGLSAYIFSKTAQNAAEYTWINAGDAQMLPALAHAKRLWRPARLLELFAVSLSQR